jgi:hypothetical protein
MLELAVVGARTPGDFAAVAMRVFALRGSSASLRRASKRSSIGGLTRRSAIAFSRARLPAYCFDQLATRLLFFSIELS